MMKCDVCGAEEPTLDENDPCPSCINKRKNERREASNKHFEKRFKRYLFYACFILVALIASAIFSPDKKQVQQNLHTTSAASKSSELESLARDHTFYQIKTVVCAKTGNQEKSARSRALWRAYQRDLFDSGRYTEAEATAAVQEASEYYRIFPEYVSGC
jgi:hypothetical protein